MSALSFTAKILKDDGSNATGVIVPPEVIEQLGMGKRPKVKVTLNGYIYRTTVGVMGGTFLIPLSAERRTAAGVKAGDELTITLEADTEPRVVALTADMERALQQAGLLEKFNALAFSHRKEYVRWVEEAKASETRLRRIEKMVADLATK